MATLTAATLSEAGVTQSLAAVTAGGDEFVNYQSRFIIIIANSSGANAYTVTVETGGTFKTHAIADQTVAVGTSETHVIGPFEVDIFNDTAGKVQLTYAGSAVATDLTIQVYKLPG